MSEIVGRIQAYLSGRGWYGADMLQDPGHQLGEERAKLEKGFLWPPAAESEVKAAEQELGFGLPLILRELLLRLGNGEFGPGYGLRGVPAVSHEQREPPAQLEEVAETVAKTNEFIRAVNVFAPEGSGFPPLTEEKVVAHRNRGVRTILDDYREGSYAGVAAGPWLPLVDWGCGVVTVIHVPSGVLIRQHDYQCFWREEESLEAWLEAWIEGEDLWVRMEREGLDVQDGCEWLRAL